jgi:Tfp pilus assembly protein FimV
MKLKIVLVAILIVGLGVGLGAGIFITKTKDKAVITDLKSKLQQSEDKNRSSGEIVSQLANQLQQTKIELEQIRQAAASTTPAAAQAVNAPAANQTTSAAPDTNAGTGDTKVYVIKSGDSLWSIAKNQLGNSNRINDILKLNPQITAKSNLVVGAKLKLPAK